MLNLSKLNLLFFSFIFSLSAHALTCNSTYENLGFIGANIDYTYNNVRCFYWEKDDPYEGKVRSYDIQGRFSPSIADNWNYIPSIDIAQCHSKDMNVCSFEFNHNK